MRAVGDKQTGTIRPEFDRSISIDFQGAKITSDTGFFLATVGKYKAGTPDISIEHDRYHEQEFRS